MVVNDLHLLRTGVGPHEADPPLVVDPDAVLPGPVTLERLEPVPRWHSEVVEHLRGADLAKLAQRDSMDSRIDRVHTFSTPQPFGVLAPERPDHYRRIERAASITLGVTYLTTRCVVDAHSSRTPVTPFARPGLRYRLSVIDEAPWSDYSRARLPRGLTYAVGRDVIQDELRRAGATIGSLSFGPPPPRPFDDDGGALIFDVYWVGDARPSRLDVYRGAPPTDRLLMRWSGVPSSVRAAIADELAQHWLPIACAWAAEAPHRGNTWAATDHRWMVVRTGTSLRLAED